MSSQINYKKITGMIALIVDLMSIIVEILIILKIIPFDIILGGQLTSYQAAVGAAIGSIVIQTLLGVSILFAVYCTENDKRKKVGCIVLKVFIVYFALNIVMNLFGRTWFEKIVGSTLGVIQIVCFYYIVKK